MSDGHTGLHTCRQSDGGLPVVLMLLEKFRLRTCSGRGVGSQETCGADNGAIHVHIHVHMRVGSPRGSSCHEWFRKSQIVQEKPLGRWCSQGAARKATWLG